MSETPRVDAKSAGLHGNYAACYGVMEEFARSLEREIQNYKNIVDAQQETMLRKIMPVIVGEVKKTCEWIKDPAFCRWTVRCGKGISVFVFPREEDRYVFCPNCGGKVVETKTLK